MKLSGAEIFVECLKREQVETIFGYPGGAVLQLYDAIFSQSHFKHILVRHEQGRCMRPTAMPGSPANAAWRWSLPVRVRPMR